MSAIAQGLSGQSKPVTLRSFVGVAMVKQDFFHHFNLLAHENWGFVCQKFGNPKFLRIPVDEEVDLT